LILITQVSSFRFQVLDFSSLVLVLAQNICKKNYTITKATRNQKPQTSIS